MGLALACSSDLFADQEMELLAPLNSNYDASADATWTARPAKPDAAATRLDVLPKSSEKLPTPKLGAASTLTPPDRVAWRDASVPQQGNSTPDGFRPSVADGNWVARDAINLDEPLHDPQALRMVPAPVKRARQAAPDGPLEKIAPREPSVIKSESKTSSMSLQEAKSAAEQAPTKQAPKTERSIEKEVATKAKATTKQASVAKPKMATDAIAVKPSQPLPKRKPRVSIVESGRSSIKSKAIKSTKSAPRNDQRAAASVGDLAPEKNIVLDYTGRPASPIQPTRTVANMRRGIERTLRYFYDHPEIATARSNWGMMHSLMVFGSETKIVVGRQKYSAIAWIAGNNNCRGQRLLTHGPNGIQAKSGVGLQGHQGQFLAVLGMCNVPTEYPLHAGQVKYDVAALIEAEKRACKVGEELTFTLVGLSHYLDTDSKWMADDGTQWDFERLIAEELKQQVVGSACGGTHRLMGYTHALRKRRAEGKPITGHWKRAEKFTNDFINYAYSLQNRDGSMSTKWFEGRADNGEMDRKVQTTGHIVEWLLTVTPDDQLQNRRLVAAVSYLLRNVGSDLEHDWSIGPKGHALRSLAMYHQRVFHAGTPWIPSRLARRAPQSQRTR